MSMSSCMFMCGKYFVSTRSIALHIEFSLLQLQSIFPSFQKNSFCLATNGPNPLRQCVFPEMSRKGLSIPQFAHVYFDLRKELSKRTGGDVIPEGLSDLCDCIRLCHFC